MRYFPLSLDTRGKKVLILGGGRAAFIKTRSLLKSEVTIHFYSEDYSDEIKKLMSENPGRTGFLKAIPDLTELKKYIFIITATGNTKLNEEIAERAKELSVPVLRADDGLKGDIIFGRIFDTESFTGIINSKIPDPTLTKAAANLIEEKLRSISTEKTELLQKLREALKKEGNEKTSEIMDKATYYILNTMNFSEEGLSEKIKKYVDK